MKRGASKAVGPAAKKAKISLPEYHLTPSKRTSSGDLIWPAPEDQLTNARRIIKECAANGKTTVICPDKDADGLSSGVILWRTLQLLGLPKDRLRLYLLEKHQTVHTEHSHAALEKLDAAYIFILDHGSRHSAPLVSSAATTTLVIDHHHATAADFPQGTEHVTACDCPPVATSALLTYEICRPLHDAVERELSWVCAVGTQGDLGNTLKWEPPFPDMKAVFKTYTKAKIAAVVSLVNAPRRTAAYDVKSAWDALLSAAESGLGPASISKDARLLEARAEINQEVEQCTHTAPKFSGDATVAVFRINSKCQVHPLIATRWANHLTSKRLEYVMCANEGHEPGKVNFSCRVAKCAKVRAKQQSNGGDGVGEDGSEGGVNIIESLKDWARQHESGDLEQRMGADFARGHVQASGGIVSTQEFEDLMSAMRVGEKFVEKNEDGSPMKKKPQQTTNNVEKSPQKNRLTNYFAKAKT